jgi:hypothetical protein
MPRFTQQDFNDRVLQTMRQGRIRTRDVFSACHDIEFYLKRENGVEEGAEIFAEWWNQMLIPEFENIETSAESTWVMNSKFDHGFAVKYPDGWENIQAVREFQRQCDHALTVFKEKNTEYGNAFASTGVLGAVSELIGCIAKLHKLVVQNPGNGAEDPKAVYNALLDAHNFAAMGMLMLQRGNYNGDPEFLENMKNGA